MQSFITFDDNSNISINDIQIDTILTKYLHTSFAEKKLHVYSKFVFKLCSVPIETCTIVIWSMQFTWGAMSGHRVAFI
jgi:hypothetical protein